MKVIKLYNDGSYFEKELKEHEMWKIEASKDKSPSAALIVNNKCVYKGEVSQELINKHIK